MSKLKVWKEAKWWHISVTFPNDYFLMVRERHNSWFYASKNYNSDENVTLLEAMKTLIKVKNEEV